MEGSKSPLLPVSSRLGIKSTPVTGIFNCHEKGPHIYIFGPCNPGANHTCFCRRTGKNAEEPIRETCSWTARSPARDPSEVRFDWKRIRTAHAGTLDCLRRNLR